MSKNDDAADAGISVMGGPVPDSDTSLVPKDQLVSSFGGGRLTPANQDSSV
jgi:hypothetical protein